MEINMKGYLLKSFSEKDIYTWDEIITKIEDLEFEVKKLKEEKEDLTLDIMENYKPIPKEEQYE